MRNLILSLLVVLAFHGVASFVFAQEPSVAGKYTFKDYRKGRGGYENHLEITDAAKNRFHLNFELTYFYMAGRHETFHEGSGEGDGQLKGDLLRATLSDGADGSCQVTLTFSADRSSVSVKSTQCQINVIPDGVYKRDGGSPVSKLAAPRPLGPRTLISAEVCPDPKSPCNTAARTFAPYEISFQLPGKLIRGKTYKSLPFYGVLIKTYSEEECDADGYTESIERERKKIQLAYPYNKVFASYSCPNLDAVDYSFAGRTDPTGERVLVMTFIAVYAGKTEANAKEFLGYVKTTYPDAKLKLMTASYEVMDQ